MSTTLLQLRNEVYDALAEATDSSVYPSSLIDSFINQAHTNILEYREFSFMETETLWNNAVDTTTNGALTSASTTVVLGDSTGWSATSPLGAFTINGDIATYTGVSSLTLTGITGLAVSHADGDDIRPIYSVPSNMWKPTVLLIDGGETDYYDYRDKDKDLGYYIYNNYLFLPSQSESLIVKLQYFKSPTTLSSDSSATEIPDRYAKMLVVPYAVNKALLYRDEQQKASLYEREFRERLSDMVKNFGRRDIKFQTRIKSYQ